MLRGDADHLGVGTAICLWGDLDKVGASLQGHLALFTFTGVQSQRSEGYLVVGREAPDDTVTTQLAGDFDRPFGVHAGNEGSRSLTGREGGLILLQVVAFHFLLLAVA